MWAVLWSAAWAACPSPVPVATLTSDLDRAERAFADLDASAFDRAMDEVAFEVGCLDAVLPTDVAARLHRLVGLRFFAARDAQHALAAFSTSRALDPAWTWPKTLLPAGHAALDLWSQAAALERAPAPTPVDGALVFDGAAAQRPVNGTTVAQLVTADRRVTASAWLRPEDPLFPYPSKKTAARRSPAAPLWVTAGAIGAAALGTYAAASASSASFDDRGVSRALRELESLRRQTNTLVWTSVGLGGAAVGFGVGALVVTL